MSASQAFALKKKVLGDHAAQNPNNTLLLIGDAMFTSYVKDGKQVLRYLDTWTGVEQETTFDSEVEMCWFLGSFLMNDEGPDDEFMKRFPAEFQEPGAPA